MFLCIIQIVITKRLLDLKPENVDSKSAYLIGSGLASLAAACFKLEIWTNEGENIHILEELDISGGSLDGINMEHHGFVVRGGKKWKIILNVYGICLEVFHH